MSEIPKDAIPAISVGPFTATPLGLIIDESASYEVWHEYGKGLRRVYGALQWVIGDWLRFGERKYGEMYAQALEIWPEYSYQSLRNMVWMAEKIELSSRLDNVSWDMHQVVAALPAEERQELLEESLAKGWTRAELRRAVAGGEEPVKAIEFEGWVSMYVDIWEGGPGHYILNIGDGEIPEGKYRVRLTPLEEEK